MQEHTSHKVIIGRSEQVSFPDLGVSEVPAKIDTGAYRSAIHADNIRLNDDNKTLGFRLFEAHPTTRQFAVDVKTNEFRKVTIYNSFGQSEDRYEVKLRIKLGSKNFMTSFTLANRSKKAYPILLGRKTINRKYIVDTSLSKINRVKLKEMHNIAFPKDEEDEKE